jgi:hypothetical protein
VRITLNGCAWMRVLQLQTSAFATVAAWSAAGAILWAPFQTVDVLGVCVRHYDPGIWRVHDIL